LDGNIEGKPFVSDDEGQVYVVTDNGTLHSLRKDNGLVVWSYDIGPSSAGFDYTSSPIAVYNSSLAPNDNVIYVGSQNGSLYVVRDAGASADLVRQFTPASPASIRSTPAVNPINGNVYFGSDNRNVYGVTAAGIGRWSVETGGEVVSSPTVSGDGRTVYVGSNNGRLYIISLNPDGSFNNAQTYPPSGDSAIGAIKSSPTIAGDGAIIFGSDDGHLYALNPDRTLRWKYPAVGSIGAVRSKPAIGPDGIIYFSAEDGRLYAIDPALNDPPNDPGLYLTPTQLQTDPTNAGSFTNNWLTEGPWAVRLEVLRSTTPNGSGKYEYTLKTWLKKCADADCTNLVGTSFFQNTRFEYDWATAGIAPMTQTIELSNTATPPPGQLDFLHDRFDRFLFGFTSASTASQTIEIRKFQLSFIRPNDPVVSD
jgi:hypothetical protein